MQVEIPKSIRSRLCKALSKAGRKEIGGILMAEQTEPGKFKIVDLTIDAITGSEAHFVRLPEHYEEALRDFFSRTQEDYLRFNYLGEWHSHPNHPPVPSQTDAQSMQDLIYGERNILFAILLIVRKAWWKRLACSATMFHHGQKPTAVDINFSD